MNESRYGKYLSPKEICERLVTAGIEWRNLSDLARMFGISRSRIHKVLGMSDKAGIGAGEFVVNQWIDKHSKNGAAFNEAACKVASKYGIPGNKLAPEEIRERLKNAGIEWDNLAHLARLLDINSVRIWRILNNKSIGICVGENTVDRWIRQYLKRDVVFIQAARKENANLAKHGKHLSPEEVCRRLKAAGLGWDTQKMLAQIIGVGQRRISYILANGACEKTVDRWIRHALRKELILKGGKSISSGSSDRQPHSSQCHAMGE